MSKWIAEFELEDEDTMPEHMDLEYKGARIDFHCRPLEQEPRKGHWILKRTFPTKLYDEYLNEYKCSECYREIRCTESQLVNYPYCHCGAKMEKEVKE